MLHRILSLAAGRGEEPPGAPFSGLPGAGCGCEVQGVGGKDRPSRGVLITTLEKKKKLHVFLVSLKQKFLALFCLRSESKKAFCHFLLICL